MDDRDCLRQILSSTERMPAEARRSALRRDVPALLEELDELHTLRARLGSDNAEYHRVLAAFIARKADVLERCRLALDEAPAA